MDGGLSSTEHVGRVDTTLLLVKEPHLLDHCGVPFHPFCWGAFARGRYRIENGSANVEVSSLSITCALLYDLSNPAGPGSGEVILATALHHRCFQE